MTVAPQEISVVIQGAVAHDLIDEVHRSVRKALPGAELILSTWKGTDTARLPAFDRVIACDDPGPLPLFSFARAPHKTVSNNVNRQIVSTQAGLRAASRKYALKMRTDMVLTGENDFLRYFGRYTDYTPGRHFFAERVINNASGSRAASLIQVCFHPGDLFYFGLREDLVALFDIPLYSLRPLAEVLDGEASNPLLSAEYDQHSLNILRDHMRCEYYPEVYLFRSFLLKHTGELKEFRSSFDYTDRWAQLSDIYLVNHFVLLQDRQIGIRCLKYPDFERDYFPQSLDYELWQILYRRHCDPGHELESIRPYVEGFVDLYRAKGHVRDAALHGTFLSYCKVFVLWTYFRILANLLKRYRVRKSYLRRFLRGRGLVDRRSARRQRDAGSVRQSAESAADKRP